MEGWKERMKGTLVKRKRSESAREQGGGFEGGSQEAGVSERWERGVAAKVVEAEES